MEFRKIIIFTRMFGIDPKKMMNALLGFPKFFVDYYNFKHQVRKLNGWKEISLYPCIEDKSLDSGSINGHYFLQDLHVAQAIFKKAPVKHLDIGSRVDGFVAHVASFRDIIIADIRQLEATDDSISYVQLDITDDILPNFKEKFDSVSCLHVVEHIGLGRYGDKIDYSGYFTTLKNLANLLSDDGTLYVSVPIGRQRVEYNAHRIFSVNYFLEIIPDSLELISFSYIDDNSDLHKEVDLDDKVKRHVNAFEYGCGIFFLKKI